MLCCHVVNLVELGQDDFEGLDHLLHLGGSCGEVEGVLASNLAQGVIFGLEDLDLALLLVDLRLVDVDGLVESLGLELGVLDFVDGQADALAVVLEILLALRSDLGALVVGVDLFALRA